MTGFLRIYSRFTCGYFCLVYHSDIFKDICVIQFGRVFKLLTLISAFSYQNNAAYLNNSFTAYTLANGFFYVCFNLRATSILAV